LRNDDSASAYVTGPATAGELVVVTEVAADSVVVGAVLSGDPVVTVALPFSPHAAMARAASMVRPVVVRGICSSSGEAPAARWDFGRRG
jgi:hypothetical protein